MIVPSFEETRAKEQLSIAGKDIKWLPWEESEDAYGQVGDVSGRIVVDEAMRVGVMDQLKRVIGNGEIGVATKEVRSLRERKSKEELALLKCANEVSRREGRGFVQFTKLTLSLFFSFILDSSPFMPFELLETKSGSGKLSWRFVRSLFPSSTRSN